MTGDEVHDWVLGLLAAVPGEVKAVVSLLGRKRDGTSEFVFYPFAGGDDEGNDGGHRSFRGWLERGYPGLVLREFPTVDLEPIAPERLSAIQAAILDLMDRGASVVVVDSGGMQRTSDVVRALGAVEDSRS